MDTKRLIWRVKTTIKLLFERGGCMLPMIFFGFFIGNFIQRDMTDAVFFGIGFTVIVSILFGIGFSVVPNQYTYPGDKTNEKNEY